jgi:hypothetical protein
MIKLEKTEVFGFEAAIRGMRNPMNSWDKSDSDFGFYYDLPDDYEPTWRNEVGENDLRLMKQLSGAGNDHGKFLRMINVTLDITAPLYWWKEFDTYKVGTVANSCSTMHKIHAKEFELDDFSCEHLGELECREMNCIIDILNRNREGFIESKDKYYWWNMIQLLPSSYNQKRTVQLNYQVLKAMYHARKNHKLDEWHIFCDWVETLPYSELITMKVENE